MDQYIGKLINSRYELQKQIGSNWMTIIYKAYCHRLNRLVVVKILRDELALDADFRDRFQNQYRAVAMLSNPNIMAVYDVGYSNRIAYIVTEFVEGITLKRYMQKKGKFLSWREALYFVTRIVEALSYAHSCGIIHQGITPQNIMVLRDGSIRITDFGTIQLFLRAKNTLTQAQAIGGNINACSDIYSTGVLLYEMLTGHLPFEGDALSSVTIQHSNSNPLSPRKLNPDIPEPLEIITMKAMATNINQRYASADEMLVDLEKFRMNPSKTVCMPKSKVEKMHKKQQGILPLLIPLIIIIFLISAALVMGYFSAVDQTSIFIRKAVELLTVVTPSELNITIFGILLTIASFFVESKNKKALCIPRIILLIIGMFLISIAFPFVWLNLS